MNKILIILFLMLGLVSCSKQEEGVYVEVSLDNKENLNAYILFNPNIKTIEECEATMDKALPSIMANLPKGIPKDSKATGWKCSLTDPAKTKPQKT